MDVEVPAAGGRGVGEENRIGRIVRIKEPVGADRLCRPLIMSESNRIVGRGTAANIKSTMPAPA